jgi:PAS domain S-box-containing protein
MCFVVYSYFTRSSELQLRATFEAESVTLASAAAALISESAGSGDVDALTRLATQIMRLPDAERMAIIDVRGHMIVSFPDSALILTPDSISTGVSVLPSSIVASAEIPGGGQLLLERSLRKTHADLTYAHAKALELCIVLAVMGTLMAWILTASVGTPLGKLASAVLRVRDGDYQKVTVPSRNDEFATLAEQFNGMVDEIARKSHALEDSNTQLRHEVLDRRMIACALEESQQHLKVVVANAPIVIFALDQNGIITISEGKPTQKLPSRPMQVIGRHFSEIYPYHERISVNAKRALAGESFSDEVSVDGRTFEVYYTPSRDDQGNPNGVIGVAVDVTTRKQFEVERNDLQNRLAEAQKMEAVGNLAGGFAHSFNNLLAGIMGHADLLRDSSGDTAQVHRSSESIYRAAERASTLTQQLLGFAGRGKFQSTKVDVHQTIENCIRLLEPGLSQSIAIEREFSAANRSLIGDPAQIEQMFLNLIKNACESMPDGGTLTLKTCNVEYERKSPTGESDLPMREHVMVSIIDTGVGIPGHLRERVFEPFFSSKPAGLGAGMGLAMAHGIIESHGGSIRFTSRVQAGTEFNVILPCAVITTGRPEGTANMDDLIKTPQQILVVDDDEIVRDMLKELLMALGYGPTCAASGFAAVEAFTTDHAKFDLVILDMLMPGMDGPECFRRLQAIDSTVPVMISSGYASNESVQGLMDGGAVGFLKKPYTIRDLSRVITECIRPRQKHAYGSTPVTITARPFTQSVVAERENEPILR